LAVILPEVFLKLSIDDVIIRSGTAGQPFPQDIKMKADAERQLTALPTYSAAYSLYENILRHVEASIASQVADREGLE
jgi:hypothetical protein